MEITVPVSLTLLPFDGPSRGAATLFEHILFIQVKTNFTRLKQYDVEYEIEKKNLFCLKTTPDQDGAIKKKFSQIGRAIPEEIGRKQTRKHPVAIYRGLAALPLASSGFAAIWVSGQWYYL